MADSKVSGTSELAATPSSGDKIPLVDVSDTSMAATGTNKWLNAARIAYLAAANTFTALQTFAPTATNVAAVNINAPASVSVPIVNAYYNGNRRVIIVESAGSSAVQLDSADLGNGVVGPYLRIQGNTNATQASSGSIILDDRAGNPRSLWIDASNNLRTHSSSPTNFTTDTSGSVVGTQTSWVGAKENIQPWDNTEDALDAILDVGLYSYRLKNDPSGTQYYGLVITEEDRANGAWFAENLAENQVPALNERNLFGYLIAAVKAQQAQIDQLRADLAALS